MNALESYAVLQAVTAMTLTTSPYRDYSEDTQLRTFSTFPGDRSAAAALDFDGDGDKDIIVVGHVLSNDSSNLGCAGRTDHFSSDGVPFFVDFTTQVFSSRPPNGTSGLIVADYDNDGDLDFYAPNPGWETVPPNPHFHRMYRNDGGYFTDVTSTVFDVAHVNMETMNGAWGDYDGDGYLDLLVGVAPTGASGEDANVASLALFHNEQASGGSNVDRVFVEVTDSGIQLANEGVFSLLWVDFDKDHDMDLVTLVYQQGSISQSKLYRNVGGSFVNISATQFPGRDDLDRGREFAAAGDFDNDGDLDIAYHGKTIRGFFRNDLDSATGDFSLVRGWFEEPGANESWYTSATGIGIFDFDLDGWLDFGISNNYSNTEGTGAQRLQRNLPGQIGFSEQGLTQSQVQTRNLSPVDWNLDGYTELFISSRDPDGNPMNFFFRNLDAANQTGTNHWVGIRLDASDPDSNDCPCNTRGIGATVIVTANGQTQAQLVDGGSGHAGQHDLDLTFGLGSYAGSVDVEVLWPCGQTQYATVPADQYTTLHLGWPTITTYNAYLEWTPAMSTVHWVFEWDTPSPSDESLDYIEFPDGVPDGGAVVHTLSSDRSDVDYTVQMTAPGTYRHVFKWLDRPCDQVMKVKYRIHSRVLDKEYVDGIALNVLACPQS